MAETPVHIRWMIRRDMPEVLDIERACFSHPWPEEEFIRNLRRRNCIGMVAEHVASVRVVAFMVYERNKSDLNLINIAVHPSYQHRGIGRQMIYSTLLSQVSHERRKTIRALVCESNTGAQEFLASQGFKATGIEHGPYANTPEDAYAFTYFADLGGYVWDAILSDSKAEK